MYNSFGVVGYPRYCTYTPGHYVPLSPYYPDSAVVLFFFQLKEKSLYNFGTYTHTKSFTPLRHQRKPLRKKQGFLHKILYKNLKIIHHKNLCKNP